ncbi:16S rRNA (guanine(966)-N(2))-methyltransferase RsmD [Periweissella ghanensis]|uniref:Ribosomal RNA small subunit methyltransferase D n=1 Tax=Periweissella ghanensis TaxID=467997 RepID=A0ABN8BNI7_9LACO|nr:16S rRNA (guanine(966)-N(2))-methyltransferase RsmD [Periweissella ghanensis]MCM0599966.1 16S rRNA (guanine(966)-N(2))-methyltransferase RsmD [Periweissella ghanensis]CAH0418235.1 Ribosomal RNA small subunit methyltransferase D [Periweissella ghanensis]
MRIIAGEFGGRPLKAVPGMATRPTTDKVKEAMFSMIGPYFDGGNSLDLFAGSGGLSIEAVSRGIDHAYLVDKQFAAIKTINENIAVTKQPNRFTVTKRDARAALQELSGQGIKFDLIFLDPPYAKQQILQDIELMVQLNLLAPAARIIAETDQKADLDDTLKGFSITNQKNYGITEVTVYQFEGI